MEKIFCGECRAWERQEGSEYGECRLLAPRLMEPLSAADWPKAQHIADKTWWPATFIDHWCLQGIGE